jgi:spermidine/putrescine transport system ATP-binding protein
MRNDGEVEIFNRRFKCLDKGFGKNEAVDVVIRPEDVDIVQVDEGQLKGTVTNVTFKGVHYDIIVDFYGFKWLIQTTDFCPVDSYIGIKIDPDGIHVMKKSEYSGMYGDYSSYSEEYEEISDATIDPEEEDQEGGDEE